MVNWVDEILDNAVRIRRTWPEWMQRIEVEGWSDEVFDGDAGKYGCEELA